MKPFFLINLRGLDCVIEGTESELRSRDERFIERKGEEANRAKT